MPYLTEQQNEYAAKIAAMDDKAFTDEVETQVWFSARANNNPKAPAHWKADTCYDESRRREKPWLYQRGWNAAYRSEGHQPSEADIEAAREPSAAQ